MASPGPSQPSQIVPADRSHKGIFTGWPKGPVTCGKIQLQPRLPAQPLSPAPSPTGIKLASGKA